MSDKQQPQPSAYQQAGVSIEAGQQAVAAFSAAVKRSHNANVLAGVGAFGGLFALRDLPEQPALVASTDGVGTKVELVSRYAEHAGSLESLGQDIVHHCVNDILCAGQGVRPLFFLDYVASSQLVPAHTARLVTGIADACSALGCALLGGETAEMPGVYQPGGLDIVGTIVGVMDSRHTYPRPDMQAGDVLIALPSSGAHTNGYSLIRKVFAGVDLEQPLSGDANGSTLSQALLQPHRCYYHALRSLESASIPVKALAHITGGGLFDNLPRVLTAGLDARIEGSSWQVPPLFQAIAAQGTIAPREMFHVFNMGIGMVLVVAQEQAQACLQQLPEAWVLGEVVQGDDAASMVRLEP